MSERAMGGGHETAYGHFLGYVRTGLEVGVINLDAHLDVRPLLDGRGHSGSPFRQTLEHPTHPLGRGRYVCLGAQAQAVSRHHVEFAEQHCAEVRWCGDVRGRLTEELTRTLDRFAAAGCRAYVTVDADVVRQADVPGVSAPNATGLDGWEVAAACRAAGLHAAVASLDVVEINPRFDSDGQSARWAAVAVWSFLSGLAGRRLTPGGQ